MINKIRTWRLNRRQQQERQRQLDDYFRVRYWHLNHAIYLRVLAAVQLLVAEGNLIGSGATRTDVKEVLFYCPLPGGTELDGSGKVNQALIALRVDGLIQRADLLRADSIGASYTLTLQGADFLDRDWVRQTLTILPPLTLSTDLRRD